MGTKTSQLDSITAIKPTDLIEIEQNNGDTTYTSKKMQLSNLPSGGEWELVERKEFAAAAQTCTFSGLNGNLARRYKMIFHHINGGAANILWIRPNNDSATNYPGRLNDYAGTQAGPSGWTGAVGSYVFDTATFTHAECIIDAITGVPRLIKSMHSQMLTTTTWRGIEDYQVFWLNTSDNITSLVCTSTDATGIGIGSYIELWRLATG